MSRHVFVAGSGAAGLVAAVTAARAGARVTVLESTATVGGSTCMSSGVTWMPGNHLMAPGSDSPQDALTYLRSFPGDVDDELCRVFVEKGPAELADLPVSWHEVNYPDNYAERPGGRTVGRSIEPDLVEVRPDVRQMVRAAPNIPALFTYAELVAGKMEPAEMAARRERGTLVMGRALVASLLQACLDAGVEVRTNAALDRLPSDDNVVLASGGFERDPGLVVAFLRGPMLAPVGAPGQVGTALRLAMAAGAELGNMAEAWWTHGLQVPGEQVDGAPMYRLCLTSGKGAIVVDARGARFFDENGNYNDTGRTLSDFDAGTATFPHIPSWLVFDAGYRASSRLGPLGPADPDPDWVFKAESIAELGASIGVPRDRLEATVARFNGMAERGVDEDFGRGSTAYGRFRGPWGPVSQPPYYAVRLLPGCLATKGGPRIDPDGRVRSVAGGVIPRLFAAGNAAASPFGTAYPGAGATIGPALVFGARAGRAAARANRSGPTVW